jgi:hypothetical protein
MAKRWDRSQYPENWEEISAAFRASKNYTCEWGGCGVKQGDKLISKAGKEYTATVDAAHVYPFDTANPNPDLLCLCKKHHRIYDNSYQGEMDELEHQTIMHRILIEKKGL